MVTVIVISTPNSSRGAALIGELGNSPEIDLKVIEATMLHDYESMRDRGVEFSEVYSSIFYGRLLSAPEIGCSDSHNKARKLLSTSPEGGVILEDDAQIVDLERFVETAKFFLSRNLIGPAVLSLYSTGVRNEGANAKELYVRLKGKPKLAVGYVLNSSAASILSKANSPIKFVADWPVAEVSYSMVTAQLVLHDETLPSTINANYGTDRNHGASRFKVFLSRLKNNDAKVSLINIFAHVIYHVSRNYIGHRIDRALGYVKD